MKRRLLCVGALALLAVLALTGCSKPRITLEVASQPNVNPDNSGRPSPVIVKMYEMRGDLAFRQGDFQTLFLEPMKALGADLVAADELTFVPGEARTVVYAPMPETRFVGVLAGFRQMERATWRAVVPVDPEKKNFVRLELNDTAVIGIDPDADWSAEESVRGYRERLKRPEPAPLSPRTDSADGAEPGGVESVPSPEDTVAPSPSYTLPRAQRGE